MVSRPSNTQSSIRLPFILFFAAFDETHSHGHSGEKKISFETFNFFYYIPHLLIWFSVFIHDSIELQTNQHFPFIPESISLPYHLMKTPLVLRSNLNGGYKISTTAQSKSYFCYHSPILVILLSQTQHLKFLPKYATQQI